MTTILDMADLMTSLRETIERELAPLRGVLVGAASGGGDVQAEARRQEEAIRTLVLAGLAPGDAARVVTTAALAEQRMPTDAEIAEDAGVTGSDADIENSRQAWWLTLARLTAWSEFTRLLEAAPLSA